MPAPLLLADVPWLLYRSFFALPSSITDGDGRPVNALLGTVNALLVAIQARPPRAVVACFGAEAATYRVELYPGYHAQRPPMPDELAHQWDRAPDLLEALGWNVADSDELEADDVMFSHARSRGRGRRRGAADHRRPRPVRSGRRPHSRALARQAVRAAVGDRRPEVRRRYGIEPPLVPDFIALRGDPSDNLPGAPGIGEKTARDLLITYGSLESAIEHAVRERPRVSAALRDNADLLRAFKRIATLQRIDVARVPDRPTDYESGATAAESLGMRRLAARLRELAKTHGLTREQLAGREEPAVPGRRRRNRTYYE